MLKSVWVQLDSSTYAMAVPGGMLVKVAYNTEGDDPEQCLGVVFVPGEHSEQINWIKAVSTMDDPTESPIVQPDEGCDQEPDKPAEVPAETQVEAPATTEPQPQ